MLIATIIYNLLYIICSYYNLFAAIDCFWEIGVSPNTCPHEELKIALIAWSNVSHLASREQLHTISGNHVIAGSEN